MLETFAQFAKFSDEEIGQMVYTLLLERKVKTVFFNKELNSKFLKENFAKAPFQARLAMAENYRFSPQELALILENESSIKVVNKLIEFNTLSLTSAEKLLERYGSKVLPGLYNALDGEYEFFKDRVKELRNKQLMEFIFRNLELIDEDLLKEIFSEPNTYFSPNSYSNLIFSLLINRRAELIESILNSKGLTIFDSVLASHLLISEAQLAVLLDKLLSIKSDESKYALMALSSNPGVGIELLEKIKNSPLDNDIKALASKNILKQSEPGFDRAKAIFERSLPSKFKPEGRVGILASLILTNQLSPESRVSALEVLNQLPTSYKLIRDFLGLTTLEIQDNLNQGYEKVPLASLDQALRYDIDQMNPEMIAILSSYLESELGKERNYWENFFTLYKTHEGDVVSLIQTSKKL